MPEPRDEQQQRDQRDQDQRRGDREEQPKYKVAAPYVTLRVKDRNDQDVVLGFYAGAVVPPSADEETVKRLLDKDMLVRIDDPVADIIAVPAGTPIPGEPPNVPVTEVPLVSHDERMARAREVVGQTRGGRRRDDDSGRDRDQRDAKRDDTGPTSTTAGTPGKAETEAPAVSEPKAAWVDYAITKGATREQAEGQSKEQLVGKYGKRS